MKASIKKIGLLCGAVGALAFGGLAIAQIVTPPQVPQMTSSDVFQDIYNGQSASTNVYASISQIRSYILGQGSQHLAAPVATVTTSVCGGTGAAVTGTDTSGQVAEAASASTSCVLTFATPFAKAPECFVSLNNVADTALKCSTTTTALTVTQTSASSNVLNYLVVGLPGG